MKQTDEIQTSDTNADAAYAQAELNEAGSDASTAEASVNSDIPTDADGKPDFSGLAAETGFKLPVKLPDHIVRIVQGYEQEIAFMEERREQLHNEMWGAIHAEYPELPKKGCHSLDTTYAEQGVVMLRGKSCPGCDGSLDELFSDDRRGERDNGDKSPLAGLAGALVGGLLRKAASGRRS